MNSEDKYKALAKERQAAALRGRNPYEAECAVRAGADRLFKWRGTRRKWDRNYATRSVGWAMKAIRVHCA
jgi:hypothetical protein